jgi:hypothetical protein
MGAACARPTPFLQSPLTVPLSGKVSGYAAVGAAWVTETEMYVPEQFAMRHAVTPAEDSVIAGPAHLTAIDAFMAKQVIMGSQENRVAWITARFSPAHMMFLCTALCLGLRIAICSLFSQAIISGWGLLSMRIHRSTGNTASACAGNVQPERQRTEPGMLTPVCRSA